jgi:hypothetical protein
MQVMKTAMPENHPYQSGGISLKEEVATESHLFRFAGGRDFSEGDNPKR